ncbi:MAG: hypothetical protein HC852_15095 [Acaryochloridaceae cyanobacterium RU_4_10]|nr:hypothetical protein [Acaryochloridaceae cyanobacterium RU_4_10]
MANTDRGVQQSKPKAIAPFIPNYRSLLPCPLKLSGFSSICAIAPFTTNDSLKISLGNGFTVVSLA